MSGAAVRVFITTQSVDAAAVDLSCLSADEMAKVEAFKFDVDRAAYGAGHSLLRSQLSRHLGVPAPDINFRYDKMGKPRMSPHHGALDFSLSHTRGMVCVAISPDHRVGVDTEAVSRMASTIEIAETMFSVRELARIRAADPDSRSEVFARFWTRKEAVAKAMGLGLSLPFADIDTDVADASPIIAHHAGKRYRLSHDMRRIGDHQIAVAVETDGRPDFVWQTAPC